jgi:hypothetical protein
MTWPSWSLLLWGVAGETDCVVNLLGVVLLGALGVLAFGLRR